MANFCTSCGESLSGRAQRPCAGCARVIHQDCLEGGLCSTCVQGGAQVAVQPEPPLSARSCPHCAAAAEPSLREQTCAQCTKRFTLYAGPALDTLLSPNPPARSVDVKWSAVFTVKSATAGPRGLAMGNMDPVLGLAALDSTTVPWHEVCSVALTRRVLVVPVILTLLLLFPLGLLIIVAARFDPVGWIFGVPFLVWGGWILYRALVVRAHWMRVVGLRRTFEIRYDRRLGRRQRFLDTVLQGCGHSPEPLS